MAGFLLGSLLVAAVFTLLLRDAPMPAAPVAPVAPVEQADVDTRSEVAPPPVVVEQQPLWSPFRSQWAADGFARRLALATDVPVEVVNAAPGVYQVVFGYRDSNERRAWIRQIESVTGLELELEPEPEPELAP